MNSKNKGFSLIELLITMTIISILFTIAVPSYQHYIKRARFQEILQATSIYKLTVEECFQNYSELEYCKSGVNGIPGSYQGKKASLIDKIVVQNGVITVTPQNYQGIKPEDDYILTPQLNALQQIEWIKSGGAVNKGYVR